jgi:hypothetical protein
MTCPDVTVAPNVIARDPEAQISTWWWLEIRPISCDVGPNVPALPT